VAFNGRVKEKVILSCIKGALTVEDFPDLDQNIISLMEASTAPQAHILTDISLMTTMPNVFQMTKLKYLTHPKIGFFITQSRNPVEQFIGKTAGQMLKTKYKFVNTLDDGIRFLSQIDSLLPSDGEMQQRLCTIRDEFVNDLDQEQNHVNYF